MRDRWNRWDLSYLRPAQVVGCIDIGGFLGWDYKIQLAKR